MMDLLLTNMQLFALHALTDVLERCGLLVMFLSAVILTAPIHCRASIDEQVMHFSKSVLIYIFDGLREITFSFLLELLTPT